MFWFPAKNKFVMTRFDFQDFNPYLVGINPAMTMDILQYIRGGHSFVNCIRAMSEAYFDDDGNEPF